MNSPTHRRARLALLLAGAVVAALPATVASADETPVDPALPTPTVPTGTSCGTADAPLWRTASTPPPEGFSVSIGVPRPTVNGVKYQGVVHAWDADGAQSADGSVDGLPVLSQSVYVPLPLTNGHAYGWHASTYDGTSYSNPTGPCYFQVDSSAPVTPTVTNPDFPPMGAGTPTKAAGQPTTFTFASAESLPEGCASAGAPDCRTSGLDHFVYGLDQAPGIGAPQVAADAQGRASLTTTLPWGVHTLYVGAVDAAGNISQAAYPMAVPSQLPPATPTLALTAPAKSNRAASLTVIGQLSAAPYASGETAHVTRTDRAHPAGVALPDAPVATDGTLRFTDGPEVGGADTYTVTYPGDSTHESASASATVQVSRTTTALSLTTNAASYGYGATARLTAHLGKTYDDRTVSLYAQPYGGSKKLVKAAKTDSHGNLTATYQVTRRTVFIAEFEGDDHYAPATATKTVTSRAKVAESLTGNYTTTHYGTVLYRVYHHTAKAKLAVTVAPAKPAQCVRFQTQRYRAGAWHTESTSACHSLTSKSTTGLSTALTMSTGGRFRIRAEYVPSAKDTGNLSTWGAWQYFTVRQ
ncbi:hypothetical protein ACWGJB_23005 [Streptomyces sp. NPDC054813]